MSNPGRCEMTKQCAARLRHTARLTVVLGIVSLAVLPSRSQQSDQGKDNMPGHNMSGMGGVDMRDMGPSMAGHM